MKNKKELLLIIFCVLFTCSAANANDHNFFFSLGAGLEEREIDTPQMKKRLSQGGGAILLDLGYRWEKFELFLHSDFTGGHVEKLNFLLKDDMIKGNFWYGSISLAPIIKYYLSNDIDKKWTPFIMAGPVYKWTEFSSDNASSLQTQYRDLEVESHGMGGIAGIGISRNTGNTYIDKMFYQLTYQQVEYRNSNSSWEVDGVGYAQETKPNDFTDRSVSLNVGMTFSDKLFNRIGEASQKVVKIFQQ